jgi:hypothetical protein
MLWISVTVNMLFFALLLLVLFTKYFDVILFQKSTPTVCGLVIDHFAARKGDLHTDAAEAFFTYCQNIDRGPQ